MADHTPGPWTVAEEESVEKGAVTFRLVDASGRYLCYLCEGSDDPDLQKRGWLPIVKARANAHLIAAAPDLLAALHEADDFLAAYFENLSASDIDDDANEVLNAVRAAIRKATGE